MPVTEVDNTRIEEYSLGVKVNNLVLIMLNLRWIYSFIIQIYFKYLKKSVSAIAKLLG